MSMTPNEYKEAAERLLNVAEESADSGDIYNLNRVQNFTSIARVYAMLAAIPDTTVQDHLPFDTGWSKQRVLAYASLYDRRRHAVDVDTNDDYVPPIDTGKVRVSEDHYTILRRNEHPADGDTTPSDAEELAIQHRRLNAEMEHKLATRACMMWGCNRARRSDGDYCDGHDRDTIG